MDATSMLLERHGWDIHAICVGGEAAEIWINGHGNVLGAQRHQGEPVGVMGEVQIMREKGEVWGLRVI